MKLVYFVTEDWYFVSHRFQLALEAKNRGYDVSVITSNHREKGNTIHNKIIDSGIKHFEIELSRNNSNVFNEMKSFQQFMNIVKSEKPDVLHCVAFKPNLYGAILNSMFRINKIVFSIAGLGTLYLNHTPFVLAAKLVFEKVFRNYVNNQSNCTIIVQNEDDYHLVIDNQLAESNQMIKVLGSGVDLKKFYYDKEKVNEAPIILTHSRILYDKGIVELIDACILLHSQNTRFKLQLIGEPDPQNVSSIPLSIIKKWQELPFMEYLGRQENIPYYLNNCNIACLPAYREGAPLSLIEACSSGRAIVTTNVPGCNAVVEHGYNGLLCEVKNSLSLAFALDSLIINTSLRERLGENARAKAEQFLNEKIINDTIVSQCYH